MRVKPLVNIVAKWAANAANAGKAYTDGIAASSDWAANTAASASNWQQGVTAAAQDGRFEKGVNAAGNQAWKDGATNKGASRYGPGVGLAKDKFSRGITKPLQVLQSLELPARFPKGDPQNINRVQAVVTALRNSKLGK